MQKRTSSTSAAATTTLGTGWFLSCDQFAGQPSDPTSLNRYTYVRNDPINMADPIGAQAGEIPIPWDRPDISVPSVSVDWRAVLAAIAAAVAGAFPDQPSNEVANVFYHGTNGETAQYLAAGGPVDVTKVLPKPGLTKNGFYLATNPAVAEYIAVTRWSEAALVQYNVRSSGLDALLAAGSELGPAPALARWGRCLGLNYMSRQVHSLCSTN